MTYGLTDPNPHSTAVLPDAQQAATRTRGSTLTTTPFARIANAVEAAGTAPKATQREQHTTASRALWFLTRLCPFGRWFLGGRNRQRFHDPIPLANIAG